MGTVVFAWEHAALAGDFPIVQTDGLLLAINRLKPIDCQWTFT